MLNPKFTENYYDAVKKLDLAGITPLIKIDNIKDALPLMGALTAANVNAAEIFFRTPAAKDILKLITSKCKNMFVGAGTVISVEQLNDAVGAGAKYIVTPAFNPKIVDRCIELGVPIFPGCSTPSDIEQAYERGLRVVKFFPAELLGGVEMIKALSGPYPFMKFIPMGGVDAENLNSYLSCGKVLYCGVGYIVDEELLKRKKFQEITRIARESINGMLDMKLDHIAINSDYKRGSELLKILSNLSGEVYKPDESMICGIEVVRENHDGNVGHIAFGSSNLERCAYYLQMRGFNVDESTVVRDNGRMAKLRLLGDFGGFTIQLIRRDSQ